MKELTNKHEYLFIDNEYNFSVIWLKIDDL